ncbi:MAG: B12-binding domain-containing radical SAM protein [Spirochaetaceae bacterium]
MNIVLTSVHISNTPDAIPLAPALLKSYIEKYNNKLDDFNISIEEFTIDDTLNKVLNTISKYKVDLIGFSIYLWNKEFYINLCKELKKVYPNIIIVAGGPEVRSSYSNLIDFGIDYTIQGEGEEVFSEFISSLLDGTDCTKIDGINDDKTRYIKDLNIIPSPILTKNLDLTKYDGYLWELSRGCPFSCDFCFESRGLAGVRYYSLERISKELNVIIKNKVPQVFVLDPTFNKDLSRAKKILKIIKDKKTDIHFHFEVRAEFLDNEICQLFTDIGASLQIGIQSAHDDILKLVNRRLNKKLFTNKISLLNDSGSIFGLDLIYGLPGDNYKGFKDSMEYVLSLQPNHIDIFPLAVLPGTTLWDNAKKLKLKYLDSTPYTVLTSDTYTAEDMNKSHDLKEACDFIYNKAKSTAWFVQVTKELNVTSIDFIETFIKWYNNSSKKVGNEVEIIKKFISFQYKPKNLTLIEDIINYHASYSKALLGEKNITTEAKLSLKNLVPTLSNTASYINFNYPILDLFDEGYYEISSIKKISKPKKSKAIAWFNNGGDVIFECYPKQIMNFINKIDGNLNCSQIDNSIDNDFLLFAQNSGMLYFN